MPFGEFLTDLLRGDLVTDLFVIVQDREPYGETPSIAPNAVRCKCSGHIRQTLARPAGRAHQENGNLCPAGRRAGRVLFVMPASRTGSQMPAVRQVRRGFDSRCPVQPSQSVTFRYEAKEVQLGPSKAKGVCVHIVSSRDYIAYPHPHINHSLARDPAHTRGVFFKVLFVLLGPPEATKQAHWDHTVGSPYWANPARRMASASSSGVVSPFTTAEASWLFIAASDSL